MLGVGVGHILEVRNLNGWDSLSLVWFGNECVVRNIGWYVCMYGWMHVWGCSWDGCYIRIVYGCPVKMISWGVLQEWVVGDWRLTGVGAGDRSARLSLANTYELMTRTWRQGGLFLRGWAGSVCSG